VHYAEFAVSAASTAAAKNTLATVLEGSIKLLHPFVPFITEEIWSKLPKSRGEQHVMMAEWPRANAQLSDPEAAREMAALQEVVTKLRTIRSEMGIPPAQRVEVVARAAGEAEAFLRKHEIALRCLNTRVGTLKISSDAARPAASAAAVVPGANLYVPLEGLIDFAKEAGRLEKELAGLRQDADRLGKKLSNHDFVTNAPAEEVARVKARMSESQDRIRHLEENLATLKLSS
jgi:valyl-tRNA synthetase